jgi:hypothetical protein
MYFLSVSEHFHIGFCKTWPWTHICTLFCVPSIARSSCVSMGIEEAAYEMCQFPQTAHSSCGWNRDTTHFWRPPLRKATFSNHSSKHEPGHWATSSLGLLNEPVSEGTSRADSWRLASPQCEVNLKVATEQTFPRGKHPSKVQNWLYYLLIRICPPKINM